MLLLQGGGEIRWTEENIKQVVLAVSSLPWLPASEESFTNEQDMKQLLLACYELGTVSSSPDALGLSFGLLTSGVTGFDRKEMMLYMCPQAHVLNVGLLTLTHWKEKIGRKNKTLVNSLHI